MKVFKWYAMIGLGWLLGAPALAVYVGGFFLPRYSPWGWDGWSWFLFWAGIGIFPSGLVLGLCQLPVMLLAKVFHLASPEDVSEDAAQVRDLDPEVRELLAHFLEDANAAKEDGTMEALRRDWPLELGRRCKGRDAYVDAWAVEKLAKAAEAIIQARSAMVQLVPQQTVFDATADVSLAALAEAWCNLAKLGAWQAGNTRAYDEKAAQAAFVEGGDAVRRHLADLLAPVLDERAS